MNKIRSIIPLLCAVVLAGFGITTQAQSTRPYRLSDREVEQNIRRLETRADNFRSTLDAALDRSRLNGTQSEDEINQYVSEFEKATDQLRDRFNSRRSVSGDVQEVLDRASSIDTFVRNNRLGRRAENDWAQVRSELDSLATAYSVAWRWDGRRDYPSGTYPTNTAQVPYRVTDREVDQVIRSIETRANTFRTSVDRALDRSRYDNTRQEDNFNALIKNFENATDRLRERFNSRRSVASDVETVLTSAAQIDGFLIRRLSNNNRVQNEWSTLRGDLDQLATFYNVAWNWRTGVGDPGYGTNAGITGTPRDGFVVPNGEQLVAVLDSDLSTRQAQDGDRFTMTVRSPSQYDGAIIEGHVSGVNRSGRVSGRSEMTFNFDRIRLTNGDTYNFAGFVNTVRTPGGETVRVNNEGNVQENESRTSTTVKRAAIGTAVGAIVGAIAGGGKGAAIGAAVGAGAGAGSVYVQGKDDLELMSGSEVTITSSAPR